MFPQQHPQNPSGIPLPANMPVPARKLDQRPPSVNNQFNNNNQQNSDIEAATLAMAMFQQQQNNNCIEENERENIQKMEIVKNKLLKYGVN